MVEIIPTSVPRDANDLAVDAELIRTFATCIHIDIDDGVFAPHTTWPYHAPGEFDAPDLSAAHDLTIEMHLMVDEPHELGVAFAKAGAMRIIGHVEAFDQADDVLKALQAWKAAGAKEAGLGLLLQTPLDVVAPFVEHCDVVHLMTIATIGTQGIPYEPSAPERVAEFHARFPSTVISVDGGVGKGNIQALAAAGASQFGVGSAIRKSDDPKAAYAELKQLAEAAR